MSTTETYYERRTSSVTARILGKDRLKGESFWSKNFLGVDF